VDVSRRPEAVGRNRKGLLATGDQGGVAAAEARPVRLWRKVKIKNKYSGRKMSDAIFIARNAKGKLAIGDKKEIDRAVWQKPRGVRLTPTSRFIRDRLFPRNRNGE
jgi:hypothetical protein